MAHNTHATGVTAVTAKPCHTTTRSTAAFAAKSPAQRIRQSGGRSAIALLCLLMAGCAGIQQHEVHQQQKQAFDTKGERLHAYMTSGKAAVDAGKLKQSAYYAKLYDLLNEPPVGPVDRIYMRGTARMAQASRQYEAGAISRQQLDATRRDVNVTSQEQTAQLQAREQAQGK